MATNPRHRVDYSRQDMTYAVRLANRGYDAHMIFRALAAKPSGRRDPGSMKYQRILESRGRDAADRYARRTAENAVRWVADNPPIKDRPGTLVRLLELRAAADAMPWALYGGAGVRRSLEAVFLLAEDLGGLSFGLALRDWAERAGQSFGETRSHRDALVRMGWLTRNTADRLGRTSRYALRRPPYLLSTFTHTGDGNVGARPHEYSPRMWLAHDAWRPGGLGDEGWYVTFQVSGTVSDLAGLAVRTGMAFETLEDLVGRLEQAEIVERRDGVLACAHDLVARLDAAAAYFGTAGRGEEDRALHARERAAFRQRADVSVGA